MNAFLVDGRVAGVWKYKDGRVQLDRRQKPEDARQALARAVAEREREQAADAHEPVSP